MVPGDHHPTFIAAVCMHGFLDIALIFLVASAIAVPLFRCFGLSAMLILGMGLALSSTAVGLQLLAQRKALETNRRCVPGFLGRRQGQLLR